MGYYFHLISVRVVRIGTAVCELTKKVSYSASAADAMMLRIIFYTTSRMKLAVGTKYSEFLGCHRLSVNQPFSKS